MPAKEPAFVYEAVDTVDVSLARILPGKDVALVVEHRLSLRVLRNHKLIFGELARHILVVEACICVEKWFLVILRLEKHEELAYRVAQSLRSESSVCFDINHRQQVLQLWLHLRTHIAKLLSLRLFGAVEVVGAHLHPVLPGHIDVVHVGFIDVAATFRCLQIAVVHTSVVAYGLPEHLSLIVAHVQSVDVVASVFALYGVLRIGKSKGSQAQYDSK